MTSSRSQLDVAADYELNIKEFGGRAWTWRILILEVT